MVFTKRRKIEPPGAVSCKLLNKDMLFLEDFGYLFLKLNAPQVLKIQLVSTIKASGQVIEFGKHSLTIKKVYFKSQCLFLFL